MLVASNTHSSQHSSTELNVGVTGELSAISQVVGA